MMEPEWRTKMREMIKIHEGLRLRPYKCSAGRWTIGYGHNLEARGEAIPKEISIRQADDYLDADMRSAEKACEAHLPYFGALDHVRRTVLVDMCFNLGINGLRNFKRMGEAIAVGRYTRASVEMIDSKWAVQVGYRAKRLAWMMAYAKWPEDLFPPAKTSARGDFE